ncbi:MAG: hypothetical protein ABI844_00020 [Saprospiraceae bacterium]
MKQLFICLSILCLAGNIIGQTFTEKISKTYKFDKKSDQNAILVYNISGDVFIEGISGDQIILEVVKTINAKTEERLARGKSEIQLGVLDRADSLIFFVEGTGQEFGWNTWSKKDSENNHWGYSWQRNNHREDQGYDYKMSFKLKVPNQVHVVASTINDGNVMVSNTLGEVNANNINGNIVLEKIAGATQASTINGDVDITYSKNPSSDCRYYSLNGHVKVNFPSSISATMSFKSFNGDLYTNVESLETMSPMVSKTSTSKGVKYKVEMDRFKIRSGGPHLDVETFNGDAYIKELK